ncbi:hypothetical protein PV04_01668 [Phialophora macrospora]|uniref:Uncharacterized protein n=1 Tax=Phialophora macrospora TaxID=1851006 RepID=A0A0D2FYF3_9EURO|nr:hypothetical protein PV04_01668 [Phialophora macrospora]
MNPDNPISPGPELSTPPRPDMTARSSNERIQVQVPGSNMTLSPSSTLSPISSFTSSSSSSSSTTAAAPTKQPQPQNLHHRAFTFHFARSRSKSPRPPPPSASASEPTPPSLLAINTSVSSPPTLKHAQTSPALGFGGQSSSVAHHHQRQPSGCAVSPTLSPGIEKRDRESWLQKKPRYSGSSPGGYGRHGDDWLFGGFSIRETAREIVSRGTRKKEDDREGKRRSS